jgi:nitrite reductase (NO-forming)
MKTVIRNHRSLFLAAALAALALDGHARAPRGSGQDIRPPRPTRAARSRATSAAAGQPVKAVLTAPPMVPPATGRNAPAKVIVELDVIEKEMPISEGVTYTFWTFGGTVPGSFIRVRQGDTVEFHLRNMPDSEDAPQHRPARRHRSRWRRGVELHRAGPCLALHLQGAQRRPVRLPLRHRAGRHARGQRHVRPDPGRAAGGLPPVDREYYVMQGDFYTTGKYREKGHQPFDMEKAIDEHPTYVLFNGAEGALTGDKALTARSARRCGCTSGNGGPTWCRAST